MSSTPSLEHAIEPVREIRVIREICDLPPINRNIDQSETRRKNKRLPDETGLGTSNCLC